MFSLLLSSIILLAQEENSPELDRQLQEAEKNLQEQIKQADELIQNLDKGSPTTVEVRVILAPRHRTILSNQISTPILSSQVSSPVKKIYKRMGEYFFKGELLIEIDDTIFVANLEKGKAVVDRARALLDARQQLYKDQISSYLDLKEAEAVAATSEAELVLAQQQLDGAYVRAPYNGRVVALSIEEFELPQPGQPLIEIVDLETLLAKLLVPSAYLNDLFIGKVLQVNVKEAGVTVDAKIIRIGSVIDPSSSTIAVDAEVENLDGKLVPGMIGTTTIGTKR